MFHNRWGFHRNRAAFAWQGAEDAGMHDGWHHGHHPHHPFGWVIMHMARRFPFGPGRPGPGGEQPFFGRGDLKWGLLELLLERPKHGYEMIKELEDQAGGFYTPSAGAVYPALQLMEDRDWITSQTIEGKKVYTITEAGKKALKEHQQDTEHLHGADRRGFGRGFGPGRGRGFGRHAGPELRQLHHETMEFTRLLWTAAIGTEGDLVKLGQLRKMVENMRQQVMDYLNEGAEKPKNREDLV